MTELISLKDIEILASKYADEWPTYAVEELVAAARAAHEWKIKYISRIVEIAAVIEERDKLLVEIAKARQEERERCAKIASNSGNHYCAAAIRALND